MSQETSQDREQASNAADGVQSPGSGNAPSTIASADPLAPLISEVRKLVADRGWSAFHDPKNLAMLIASEAGELLAEYRWVQNGEADAHSRAPEARARIAAEIGDVGIGLLLLCDRIGLDLREVIRTKLADVARKYPAEESRGRPDRKR